MAYSAFDPRETFREENGTQRYDPDGNLIYCLAVSALSETIYIPIYLSEEVKKDNLPNMPYMYLHIPIGGTRYEPHDIGAATRKMSSFIEIHICFTNTDNINVVDFQKAIKDKLQDIVRTNQSTTSGITFMNIDDDGGEWETNGRQVYFHYMATLYCLYYDLC